MIKKTIELGKVNGKTGLVEFELKETEKGLVFSMSGQLGLGRGCEMAGQCIPDLLKLFPANKDLARMAKVWKRWHLNDLHAGCEHQRELGWEKDGYDKHPSEPCPVCGYGFGTEWKFEALPEDIINEIKSW